MRVLIKTHRLLGTLWQGAKYGTVIALSGLSIAFAANHSLRAAGLAFAVLIGSLLALLILTRAGINGLLSLAGVMAALLVPLNALRPFPWFSFGDVSLALLSLLVLLWKSTQRNRPMPQGYGLFLIGALALVLGGLLGSFQSDEQIPGVLNLLRLAVAAAGVPTCLLLWNPPGQQVRKMLWAWQLANSASVIVGLVFARTFFGRAYGLTTHVNHLGLLCLLSVGVGCTLFIEGRSVKRWIALVSIFLAVIGILESGSRAALVGLVGWLLAITWAWRGPRGMLLVALLCVSGYFMINSHLISLPTHNAYSRLVSEDPGTNESNVGRLQRLQTTLTEINRHPFLGNGLASPGLAHNIYLQIWATTGLLGLIGLILIAWVCVKPFLGALSSQGSASLKPLQVLSATYLSYLIAALFSNNVWDRYLWLLVGFVLVMASSPTSAKGSETLTPVWNSSHENAARSSMNCNGTFIHPNYHSLFIRRPVRNTNRASQRGSRR